MKKIFLMGLVAAAMMTGCNNDETVEMPQKNAIGFTNAFVDKTVKATDIITDELDKFYVYGYMEEPGGVVFDNEEVTGPNPDWDYTNTQYWTAGKNYYFTAIAPTAGGWIFAPLSSGAAAQGGTISFTNNGETDLLYAYEAVAAETASADYDKVPFTFSHMLSRVKFSFENVAANSNTTYKVTSVKITDAIEKADCDVAGNNKVWTNPTGTLTLDFGGITTSIAKGADAEVAHKYMIPANRKYTLELVVEMYQGTVLANTFNYTAADLGAIEVPAVPTTGMLAGNSYVFHAELNPADELYPIEFEVNVVEDWGVWPATPEEITIP